MNKFENIKDIFFDLDHTLWDFDKNSALAFEHIFRKNKIDVPLDQFLEVYLPINFKYWKFYREARITKEKLRYGRLHQSFNQLGYSINDQLINRLSEDYILHLPDHNHLFNGAQHVLCELSQHFNLHIITNGFEEVQHIKLKRSGIDHYFNTLTSSEATGVKKPDPKIFNYAIKHAHATAAQSLMIGDTYEADIIGARNVGMHTILFNYHKETVTSENRVVDQLIDILDYI